jgi:peroxiredoxin
VKDTIASPLTGRQAPDFTLPRTRYQTFSLRDVRGNPAILVFYPGDWDPVSCQQLHLYQEYLPELRRFEASLVAISVDSVWSHAALGRALGLSFPLLSDFQPKGQVARAYQVYRETEGQSARALFVVGPEGIIHWSHTYPTNLNPGVQGIVSTLETLNKRRTSSGSNDLSKVNVND